MGGMTRQTYGLLDSLERKTVTDKRGDLHLARENQVRRFFLQFH